MLRNRLGTALAAIALLSACGGGGGGSGGGAPNPPPTSGTPTPPPPPPSSTTAGCSLRERQDWVAAQLNEWYLFPETLPASPSPAGFTSVQAYIDFLTATARAQGRDRFFTFITSIAQENAFFNSGSSAGFGIRLGLDNAQQRVFISEAFEGAPALAAGIDRGAEIATIGTSASTLETVSSIIAARGGAGVTQALGPSDPGVTRVLRITDASGTRDVTLTKAEFELLPISTRYGTKVINDGGRSVAYVNMRTFISTADPALRRAFADFRARGITEFIIDFRYNGGGLVRTAELMGDLLGANRTTADVFSFTTFRPSKSQFNGQRNFAPQAESVAPTKIAFIGTGGTASASELVINSFIPYLQNNVALVGTNTFGKPVGQIGLDRAACDDRLRVVAFKTENRDRRGEYFSGLAGEVKATCQATDDISRPLGDPQEASTARALDFLAGRSCTPISSGGATTLRVREPQNQRELLMPQSPTTTQRETPGAF